MSNDYYNATTTIARLSRGVSSIVNGIFAAIAAGFDSLPGKDELNQDRVTFVTAGGTGDALTVTMPSTGTISAYTAGLRLGVLLTATNTGAATINVDAVGAKSIKLFNGTNPAAGDLTSGDIALLIYDGTNFVMVNTPRSVVSGLTSLGSNLVFSGNDYFTQALGIGTSSPSTYASKLAIVDGTVDGRTYLALANGAVDQFLKIGINANEAQIACDNGDALVFGAMTNAASTDIDTEWGRFSSSGHFLVGKTATSLATAGAEMRTEGLGMFTVSGSTCLAVNRLSNDGDLIDLAQATVTEGTISVSGNTVSYNNFQGSHYSELDGAAAELLPGTVVEATGNLVSERFHRGDRLTKFKVSDAAGSPAVYGVILGPSYEDIEVPPDGTEDDKGRKLTLAQRLAASESLRYPAKGGRNRKAPEGRDAVRTQYFVAAVGAGHIRMKAGETLAVGALIESAGDGTGQVQGDDIIRSKTVAKLTSTEVVQTYPDGSVLVPCVLYCG